MVVDQTDYCKAAHLSNEPSTILSPIILLQRIGHRTYTKDGNLMFLRADGHNKSGRKVVVRSGVVSRYYVILRILRQRPKIISQ